MDKTDYLLRQIPTDDWKDYQELARQSGVSAAELLRDYIQKSAQSWRKNEIARTEARLMELKQLRLTS